jgi:hypothetical protein
MSKHETVYSRTEEHTFPAERRGGIEIHPAHTVSKTWRVRHKPQRFATRDDARTFVTDQKIAKAARAKRRLAKHEERLRRRAAHRIAA